LVAYQHPEELNPLQRYRQASSILSGTSRATNDGWYANPLDLDFQLHLRLDGARVESRIFHRETGTWTPGPEFSEELLLDDSKAPAFADEVMAAARRSGAKAAGVILHIADEFATTEINPELDNPGALPELKEDIVVEPGTVLDDSSLSPDEHSWRLVPYPASGSETIATAVTLSRRADPFVSALRSHGEQRNFPIVTIAVSAPLVALLALPEVKPQAERPFLTVLTYQRFTVLAFFNEHGDLRLARTLQHRGQRRPSNLRHAASTTAAALEMAELDILILPLAGEADPQLVSDLQVVFEHATIREIDWSKTPLGSGNNAEVAPEFAAATGIHRELEAPIASSATFTTLRDERWAAQDFLPLAPDRAQIYPLRVEMKMLRAARYARWGLIAVAIGVVGWTALGLIDTIRKPEWTFNDTEAQAGASRLSTLGVEQRRIKHWENLLDDRSKGWASMELLARLFPERSGFLVRTFSHTAHPETSPGQQQVGFVKEWRINGLAREEGLQRLADLNTREGVSAVFTEVARVSGNQAYRTDLPSRSIVVNIKTLENGSFKPVPPEAAMPEDESTYPFIFDLKITQRFEAADPMALLTSKAP